MWTVPVGGMCVRQPVSIGGSGSTFLYGMMDYMYKEKMAQADCEKLVMQMVTQAIRRDGSSGGCCRLATITKVNHQKIGVSLHNIIIIHIRTESRGSFS